MYTPANPLGSNVLSTIFHGRVNIRRGGGEDGGGGGFCPYTICSFTFLVL